MKQYKNLKKALFLLIGCIILAYIAFFIYEGVNELSKNPIKWEGAAPQDYIGLFNKTTQQKLSVREGISFKLRNTIIYFNYDNKYDLELTKLNSKPNLLLQSDIIEMYSKPKGSYSNGNKPENYTDFISNYKAASLDTASKIYLSLQGDSVKTVVKNDSVACYYLKVKNAYVQYKLNGVYEVFVEAKPKFHFFYY